MLKFDCSFFLLHAGFLIIELFFSDFDKTINQAAKAPRQFRQIKRHCIEIPASLHGSQDQESLAFLYSPV